MCRKKVFGITDHHAKRVAWLCIQMGKQANMKEEEISDMAIAALLHNNALTEDRPYKAGMTHGKAFGILYELAEKGELDVAIVADIDSVFADGNALSTELEKTALFQCPVCGHI